MLSKDNQSVWELAYLKNFTYSNVFRSYISIIGIIIPFWQEPQQQKMERG